MHNNFFLIIILLIIGLGGCGEDDESSGVDAQSVAELEDLNSQEPFYFYMSRNYSNFIIVYPLENDFH